MNASFSHILRAMMLWGALHTPEAQPGQTSTQEQPLPPGAIARLGTARQGSGNGVSSLAFSPDGARVAATGTDHTILLWGAATGKELRRFTGHEDRVNVVAFSPDGALLASGSHDTTLRLWDVESGNERHQIQKPECDFRSLLFLPQGKTLASTGPHATIHLWELPSGREILKLQGPGEEIDSLALSPDGKLLASGNSSGTADRTIHLWDLASGKDLITIEGHGQSIRLAFSPDGRYLASASAQHLVCLWELATGRRALKLHRSELAANAIAFSPDGSMLAIGGNLGVSFWEVANGKRLLEGLASRIVVDSLAFSPDGRRLATGLRDGTILLWDLPSDKPAKPSLLPPDLDDLERPWTDLSGRDAGRARQALWILAQGGERSVEHLRSRLKCLPPTPERVQRIRQAIHDLDTDEVSARQAATRVLEQSGSDAENLLRAALQGSPSAELRARVESLIASLERVVLVPDDDLLRRLRAIELLERIGSKSARTLLETLATGSLSSREKARAMEALTRLEKRPEGATPPASGPHTPGAKPGGSLRAAPPEVLFEEQLLATIPEDATWTGVAISPDGRRAGYMAWDPERRKGFAVVGAQKGEEFDRVREDGAYQQAMVYSADGKHLAYFASDQNHWWLILDGQKRGTGLDSEKRPEPSGFCNPVFSPDGLHVAFHAKSMSARKSFVVVDDRTGQAFDQLRDPIVFSPDASLVAYAARDERGERGFLVVGDRISDAFDKVNAPAFSPDGKHLAYPASGGGKGFVVLDDRELEDFDGVGSPVFSPDGKRLAYAAQIRSDDEEQGFLMVDGVRGKPFDQVQSPVWSADGRRLAYSARKDKKWRVIVDDLEGDDFDEVGPPVFSPDGTQVAYAAKRGGKYILVAAGRRGEEFDRVWPPVFSPDGKRVAYGARQGRALLWKILELK